MQAIIVLLLPAFFGLACCTDNCYVCQVYAENLLTFTQQPPSDTVTGLCHLSLVLLGQQSLAGKCNVVSGQHTTMWNYIQSNPNALAVTVCREAGLCPTMLLSAVEQSYYQPNEDPMKTAMVQRTSSECDLCRLVASIMKVSRGSSENTDDFCEKYCYTATSQNERKDPLYYNQHG